MSSSHPESKFAVEGPEGFLCFTNAGGIRWAEEIFAWRFLTAERAWMVLYELGLVNCGSFRVVTIQDRPRTDRR